jgi:subtilase family serine protease
MPVTWGGTLAVDANKAASRNKNNTGLCQFQIEYSVRNIGKAPTGSFRSLWTNDAVTGNWTRAWSPIAAGGVKSEKDLVPLKPGRNVLQLVLDDLHQMQESNEANNTFSLTINVTGSCGAGTGITPPARTPLRR